MHDIDTREKILRLFRPFDNEIFPVRNRFVRSATWLGACGADGSMTPAAVSRHAEAAAGGAGTVVSEFAYVSREGKAASRQWAIDCDDAEKEVSDLAEAVHRHGSKLVVQICHAGGALSSQFSGVSEGFSPSGIGMVGSDVPCRAMTDEDIDTVFAQFSAAARRAARGGADGVEIHAAHGFLFTQFLSPIFNRRKDCYGGSLENRMRFMLDACSAVRAAVGPSFPVWLKISVSEGIVGGYGPGDGIEAAAAAFRSGVDVVEVSSGTWYSEAGHAPSMVGISAGESEAPFAGFARSVKDKAPSGSLIALTGGLRSLPVIAGLLDGGAADFFSMSRPFIAEPDLINRWAEDDARPSACISCNACFRTAASGAVDCPIMRDREEGEWAPL